MMTQEAILPETVELLDPATVELTEREAVAAAIDGLRELIEHKYHFCDRFERMMGERLPASIKRDQNQRILYLAVIKKLEGLMWWEEDKKPKGKRANPMAQPIQLDEPAGMRGV